MRRLALLAVWSVFLAFPLATGLSNAARAADPPHGAEAAGAAAEPHGEPNILEFKLSLAVATLIVFLVLLLVLWRTAWGPLSKALHDREHRMEHTLQETERARADAERFLAEHRKLIEQANDQARAIQDEARRSNQALKDEFIKQAQAEAEAVRQRAERDIAVARDQALKEIWAQTANLSVDIAGKVLARELRDDDHRRLIDQAMAELPASPPGQEGLN